MNLSRLSSWLTGIGIVMLAFSFVWPKVVGSGLTYTDEDAQAYQEASVRLHNRLHSHGSDGHHHSPEAGDHSAVSEAELKQAWEQFNNAQSRRDAALHRGETSARVAQWLGILSVIGGVAVYVVQRIRKA
jgi:hypothetical protein